jgi:hypothetical protein
MWLFMNEKSVSAWFHMEFFHYRDIGAFFTYLDQIHIILTPIWTRFTSVLNSAQKWLQKKISSIFFTNFEKKNLGIASTLLSI